MMNIALIGCGKMGSALATRIIQAGLPLIVHNRTPEKCQPLVDLGAELANSLQDAVKNADIVITSLYDDNSVLETTQHFVKCLKPGTIHMSTSTVSPSTSNLLQKLHEEKASHYIAANVLGVPKAALAGKLTTLVAGNNDAIEKCRFIFETYSEKILVIGKNAGDANVIKISLNYIILTSLELISELYVYSERNGLNLDIIHDFLMNFYAHPAIKLYIEKIKKRDFDQVNFDMRGGIKDLNIFQKSFADSGVVPELANIVCGRMIAALAQGLEKKDWSAIYEVVRRESGLEK